MAVNRTEAEELEILKKVQTRIRTLVREHPWLSEAICRASEGYAALVDRYVGERSAMRDRERRLARTLLADGWLFDPKARDNSPSLTVRVDGLCPIALASELKQHGRGDTLPRELEQDGAAAALAAFDRDVIYQNRDLPEKMRESMAAEYRAALEAKTHVSFVWRIVVSRPADWLQPPDPHRLDQADLGRFVDADYRTIALHRLGGLADVGALRLIVAEPKPTGDLMRDVRAAATWRARLPVEEDVREPADPIQGRPSAEAFPADVAEQMLQDVEAWVRSECAKRPPAVDAGNGVGGKVPAGKQMGTVVLWEGAEHTDRNIRLARTRTAYLEAHGNVCAALKALEKDGHAIGKSTLYDHLKVLDTECRGWRGHLLVSGASGIPENGVIVRKPKNSRGNSR